jgi:hypothetical protein
MAIKPYKWEGLWVFDDERAGLVKEPFVGGADDIIDIVVASKGIRNAERGFLLLFSKHRFPGAELKLKWLREDFGGNVYEWEGHEGWLCPALLKFFPTAPMEIYVQAKEIRAKSAP